jgi:hypothetical protein
MAIKDDDERLIRERRELQAQSLDYLRKQREGRYKSHYNIELYNQLQKRQQAEMWNQKDRVDTWSLGHETGMSQRKVRNYTVLTDPELGIYETKARAQGLAMYKIGYRAWHHHYQIDIIDVNIDIFGRNIHVSITPQDNFEFEFMTSGWPITMQKVGQEGSTFDAYKGVCINTSVAVTNGVTTVRSKINAYRRTQDKHSGDDLSLIKRLYMVLMISEPVALPQSNEKFGRSRFPRNLFESWAPHHPHSGMHYRDTQRFDYSGDYRVVPQPVPGGLLQHSLRDFGFDVPFNDNFGTDPIRTAFIRLDADWPRACGLQLVQDKTLDIEREFAIYVDAFGVFNVFPTAAIQPLNPINPTDQNVLEIYVQRKSITWPTWAVKPTMKFSDYYATVPPTLQKVTEGIIDQVEVDWKFNHLGTKAVALVYEREPFTNDAAYYATQQGSTPWTQAMFDDMNQRMGVASRHNAGMAIGYKEQRYFMLPGILEVTVKIDLTGPDLNQYVATVTVKELRRPTTMTRVALLVGYCWHDCFRDGKDNLGKKTRTKIASAGDLCVLDVERWGSGKRFSAVPQSTQYARTENENILSLRKMGATVAEDVEINSFRGCPVLGADMNTLSFALMPNNWPTDDKIKAPAKPGAPNGPSPIELGMYRYDFGVMIVHSGNVVDTLFPPSMPEARRQALSTRYAQSGRDFIKTKTVDVFPVWKYVPPQGEPGMDAWNDFGINELRRWWAGTRGYKTAGGTYDEDIFAKCLGLWGQEMGDDFHMFIGTKPRWGWSCYSSVLCSTMWIDPKITFYAHPNGTWAFYADQFIYMDQPAMLAYEVVPGTAIQANTLTAWDEKKVEHVIFDKVHFEMRSKTRVLGSKDSSFIKMYNNAVKSAKQLEMLQDLTIQPIPDDKTESSGQVTKSPIYAKFKKEALDLGSYGLGGMTVLNLAATWYDKTYKYLEFGVQGGTYYNVLIPVFGGIVGLNFDYSTWADKDGNDITPADDTAAFHLRFCDPIVLSNLR